MQFIEYIQTFLTANGFQCHLAWLPDIQACMVYFRKDEQIPRVRRFSFGEIKTLNWEEVANSLIKDTMEVENDAN